MSEAIGNASWLQQLHTPTPLGRVDRRPSARGQLVRSEAAKGPGPLAPSSTLAGDRKPEASTSQPDRQLARPSSSGPIANPFKPPPPSQPSTAVGQPQASTSAVAASAPSTPASKLGGSGLESKLRPSDGVPSISAASAHAAGRALAAKRLRMSIRCGFCYAVVRFSRLNRCVSAS